LSSKLNDDRFVSFIFQSTHLMLLLMPGTNIMIILMIYSVEA
jgi:hypothetical protein